VPNQINSLRQRIGSAEKPLSRLIEIAEQCRAQPTLHFLATDVPQVPIAAILAVEPMKFGVGTVEWLAGECKDKALVGIREGLGLNDSRDHLWKPREQTVRP